MAWAEKQYHQCLLNSPEADAARRYLQERGITAESIERFHLGLLAAGTRLDSAGVPRARCEPREACNAGRRFSRRSASSPGRPRAEALTTASGAGCCFPSATPRAGRWASAAGCCRNWARRVPAKYVNSPETPLFTKSKLLYGLDLAREALRKTRTALVMEGYTDVIVAHQYGFQNAVAVLGTALGESHIRLLKAHADRIVLVLDGDEAGTRRANEVLELFIAQQADLRILTLPEDLDPCDYLHKYGAEAFPELLATKAVDALDHAYEVTTRGIDVERDIHGVGQAIERLLGIVAKAPRLSGETPGRCRIQEQKIVQRLAAKFRVDEQELRRRLTALRRQAATRRGSAAATAAGVSTRNGSADAGADGRLRTASGG